MDRQRIADSFGSSLIAIARRGGEPAIDKAIAEWDASEETRRLLNPVLVQNARNEARQMIAHGIAPWLREDLS
jgi:hypothetical protein